MKIIKVRPSDRFKGCWNSFEIPGVEPTFANPNSKQKAIDYACGRFGGFPKGEVHVCADDGKTVERIIPIDGGSGYASFSRPPTS